MSDPIYILGFLFVGLGLFGLGFSAGMRYEKAKMREAIERVMRLRRENLIP